MYENTYAISNRYYKYSNWSTDLNTIEVYEVAVDGLNLAFLSFDEFRPPVQLHVGRHLSIKSSDVNRLCVAFN